MLKTIIFLITGLALGLAAATFWPGDPARIASPQGSAVGGLTARISSLEAALNRETLRRAELEMELVALADELDALRAGAVGAAEPPLRSEDFEASGRAEPEAAASLAPLSRRRRAAGDREQLAALLIESGFGADRAAWISQRTSELRMQALQAQYDAARGGERDPRAMGAAGETLRAELGDADYERYLKATGRPTSVRVTEVLASSPAEQAGLLPGDEVIAYSGQRIFNNADLNRVLLEGAAGEPVAVDVVRDGQTLQLVLPRGPLGIWSGRGPGRR